MAPFPLVNTGPIHKENYFAPKNKLQPRWLASPPRRCCLHEPIKDRHKDTSSKGLIAQIHSCRVCVQTKFKQFGLLCALTLKEKMGQKLHANLHCLVECPALCLVITSEINEQIRGGQKVGWKVKSKALQDIFLCQYTQSCLIFNNAEQYFIV